MQRIGLLVILLLISVVLMPTILLVAFLALPSAMVFVLDKGDPKYLSMTIAFPNVAGTVPAILDLWGEGQSYAASLSLMFEPTNIATAYLAAAAGVAVFIFIRPSVKIYLSSNSDKKVARITKVQNELIEAWGEEVIGINPPPGESTHAEGTQVVMLKDQAKGKVSSED